MLKEMNVVSEQVRTYLYISVWIYVDLSIYRYIDISIQMNTHLYMYDSYQDRYVLHMYVCISV